MLRLTRRIHQRQQLLQSIRRVKEYHKEKYQNVAKNQAKLFSNAVGDTETIYILA